jgi:hypothetical protein
LKGVPVSKEMEAIVGWVSLLVLVSMLTAIAIMFFA